MKKVLFIVALTTLASGLNAQSSISNQGVIFIGNGAKVTILGSYVHQSGSDGLQVDGGGELYLSGDFVNESPGSVSEGYTGKIIFNGSSIQTLKTSGFGVALFHEIELQNSNGLILDGPSSVSGNKDLQLGSVNLSTSELQFVYLPTIDAARQETAGTLVPESTNRLFTNSTGKATTDFREYTSPDLNSFVNVAGLGAYIKINGFLLGDLKVERSHLQQNANSANESILRTYNISVRDGGGLPFDLLPASLQFHYLDSELGTIGGQENNFILFKSDDNGATWKNQGGIVDTGQNFVELNNIQYLNGLWTVSYCVPPTVSLGSDVALCPGGSTELAATPLGTAPFTYKWFNEGVEVTGHTNSTLTITVDETPENYSVVITDAKGCANQDNIQITIRDLPLIELGADVSVCANVAAPIDAGSGFTTYEWFDMNNQSIGTNQLLLATQPGKYELEITDAFGCLNKDSLNVLHLPLPQSNLTPHVSTCGNAFTLGSGLEALNTNATYAWRNSENVTISSQSTVTVNQDGDYSVTITGSNLCEITSQTNVTLNTTNLVDLGEDKNICAQSSVQLIATRPNSSYVWSTGETTESILFNIGNNTAEVWVDVTDITSNCTGRDSITVFAEALPLIDLGNDVTVCENTNATLDAGAGFTSYLWNNSSTSQTLQVSVAGTYSVEVTNLFGCKNSDGVVFGFYPPIQLNFTPEIATCGNEIELGIGLSGLNPGATYLWSNNQTTSTIKVSQPGQYSVTITDSHGCTKSGSTMAILNSTNFVNLGADITMECKSVSIDAGNPGSAFAWTDGQTTQTILVDKPGTYSVTVTNPFGCMDSDEINVVLLPPIDSAFFLSATEAMVNDTIYFIGLTSATTTKTIWDFDDSHALEGNSLFSSHPYAEIGQYHPSLTTVFENGCEDMYDKQITIIPVSGRVAQQPLDEPLIDEITIYPNPTDGRFRVDIKLNAVARVEMFIVNSLGVSMVPPYLGEGLDFYQVNYDLRNIDRGVYILSIVAGNEGKKFRLIVN